MRKTKLVAYLLPLLLAGCLPPVEPPPPPDLQPLNDKLSALEASLEQTKASLADYSRDQGEAQEALHTDVSTILLTIDEIPGVVTRTCAPLRQKTPVCEAKVQKVLVKDDSMVLGAVERVWLEPPGELITARIDTGASSSSIHAEEVQQFERDGDAWVRFDLTTDNGKTTLERKIIRHVRVLQQADSDGSRRPVVAFRISLGDIRDTFEFTLADRGHLENSMILGRNFLVDVALVDVSKEFIQPTPSAQVRP
ncbi:MAG: RimK/LysX family protein [Proteobacteria bacterium]|nr:RimK/LysX family protein [Pseudomonadota bacterium]